MLEEFPPLRFISASPSQSLAFTKIVCGFRTSAREYSLAAGAVISRRPALTLHALFSHVPQTPPRTQGATSNGAYRSITRDSR